MTDVLVVAGDDPWPPRQGGQVRIAGLVEGLAAHFDVTVVVPRRVGTTPPVPVYSLDVQTQPRWLQFVSRKPRLGLGLLGADGDEEVARLARQLGARSMLFTHSYLAAVAGQVEVPFAIDFANVESARFASLATIGPLKNRVSARFESVKAKRWEPRVARSAGLCMTPSGEDAQTIRRWGANAVTVPNGVRLPKTRVHSPAGGYVLFLGSADYGPNRDAVRWFAQRVWPLVRCRVPSARFRIAGRGSDAHLSEFAAYPGIEVVGEVPDTAPEYAQAAVVVVPVTRGGGRQLKVIEAIAQGRIVVATRYSAKSIPDGFDTMCDVADDSAAFADAVSANLCEVRMRHTRELVALEHGPGLPSWSTVMLPAVEWFRKVL